MRDAYCFAKRAFCRFSVYERAALAPGHALLGPAIIDEGTSTTVIHSDQRLSVDVYGNLLIDMRLT
jgi:N-methylhydantoinase A